MYPPDFENRLAETAHTKRKSNCAGTFMFLMGLTEKDAYMEPGAYRINWNFQRMPCNLDPSVPIPDDAVGIAISPPWAPYYYYHLAALSPDRSETPIKVIERAGLNGDMKETTIYLAAADYEVGHLQEGFILTYLVRK